MAQNPVTTGVPLGTTMALSSMSMDELVNMTANLMSLTQSLQQRLEVSETSMKHLAENSDAFFIIMNAIIIFCE